MEGEPQDRKVLVPGPWMHPGLQHGPQLIAEVADESARERRQVAPLVCRAVVAVRSGTAAWEAAEQEARIREGIEAGGRLGQDGKGVRGEVAPSRAGLRSSQFEQGSPRQIAERLRDLHERDPVEAGQALGADEARVVRFVASRGSERGHRTIICGRRQSPPKPALAHCAWPRAPADDPPWGPRPAPTASQLTATGALFSIGTPIRLPHSVHEPS